MKSRPPVRNTKELAAEFGVSQRSLVNTIRQDTTAPAPIFERKVLQPGFNNANTSMGTNNQYPLAEMRAWWAARQAEKESSKKQ